MSPLTLRGFDSLKLSILTAWTTEIFLTENWINFPWIWILISIFGTCSLVLLIIAILSWCNIDIETMVPPWLWEKLLVTTKEPLEKDREFDKL